MTVELDDATAALLWDICVQLDDNLEDIGFIIREAVVCRTKLEDALAAAGYNEFARLQMQRPPVPKLIPGRKYKPPTTPPAQ